MMKTPLSPFQSLMVVIASFVIASVINIYPMGLEASLLRPMALIMVLVFWLIFKPNYVGVVTAFAIGIISDLLLDTRLGQQAFAAVVIIAFCVGFLGQYIKELNLSTGLGCGNHCLNSFQVHSMVGTISYPEHIFC